MAFAKTGNPATAEVKIPRYDPRHEQRLVFGDNGSSAETLKPAVLDFMEAHPARRN
ncbi:MAG TPA: hypothetical protein VFQ52_07825 [Rhizomicrobium sp.]|nr:hypothetical protein [Rhizomicrobium sp.]